MTPAPVPKLGIDTHLALSNFYIGDKIDVTSPEDIMRQSVKYLVQNKLVADENEVEVLRGPFVELEKHQLRLEEEGLDDVPMEVEEVKDEEFELKCTICPKVNSEQGQKIFKDIAVDYNSTHKNNFKKLSLPTEMEKTRFSPHQALLDDCVTYLGSEWKLIADYMSVHPFYVEDSRKEIEQYK